MADDRPLNLIQLCRALSARIIDPGPDVGYPCPGCGVLTPPAITTGGPSYCYPCTAAELPGTEQDNAVRVEQKLTWGQYWARVERYGTVWQNPKAWATPKARLRR